jgi:hypothetical protein
MDRKPFGAKCGASRRRKHIVKDATVALRGFSRAGALLRPGSRKDRSHELSRCSRDRGNGLGGRRPKTFSSAPGLQLGARSRLAPLVVRLGTARRRPRCAVPVAADHSGDLEPRNRAGAGAVLTDKTVSQNRGSGASGQQRRRCGVQGSCGCGSSFGGVGSFSRRLRLRRRRTGSSRSPRLRSSTAGGVSAEPAKTCAIQSTRDLRGAVVTHVSKARAVCQADDKLRCPHASSPRNPPAI